MAQVVKRKAKPAAPKRAPAAPEAAQGRAPDENAPLSTVRAGAEEVRDKLRQDLSRWMRVRRVVTLRPTVGCVPCDATGRTLCPTCDGSGRTRFVVVGEDEEQTRPCATCEGTGDITCVDCAGAGELPNVHRKKILWVLGLGALAWIIVLWTFLGRDLLPAERAKLLHKGGGVSAKPSAVHGGMLGPGRTLQPGGPGLATQPGTGTGSLAPGTPATPGGQPAGVPGAPAGQMQHGASWHPTGR